MPTFYVYPLKGKPLHSVVVADGEWTMTVPLGHRFDPPDSARYQGYDLAYGPQPLWRLATDFEVQTILSLLDHEDRDSLYARETVLESYKVRSRRLLVPHVSKKDA